MALNIEEHPPRPRFRQAVKTILKEFDPWVSVFLSSRGIQVKEIEITPKTDLSYMGTEVIITIRGETLGYYDP